MKKKILCLLLALLVINLSFPYVTWAATEGTCGAEDGESNITWGFDDASGTLTISGSGEMKDYDSSNTTPWYEHIDKIKSVTITSGVKSIGKYAFCSCSNLTSVTIPEGVTKIGDSAFEGCTSLQSVNIPENVTRIRYKTFKDCKSLTSVTIPNSVTQIEIFAFENCTSLTSMTIPNGVTQIEYQAFKNCTNLESVTISDSVKYIGGDAFYGTKWLDQQREQNGPLVVVNNILIDGKKASGEVSIPEGVTKIGDFAFEGCDNLTSVTIPDSVTFIGRSAFEGCRKLISASIPSSVTSTGDSIFKNCTSLELVNIPASVNVIWPATFLNCTSLKSVTIPASVEIINNLAFYGCTSLQSVTIPKSVKYIRVQAFRECKSLTSVTIPATVTEIGNSVFEVCNSLETVFYNNEGPNIESAGIPAQTARIAYKVNDHQDEPDTKTQVTLVSTSKDVTIKCNAMGEGYGTPDNQTAGLEKKVTITHYWDDGTVTKEPTCTEAGSKKLTCTVCNTTEEETIEAGHKFSPEWSSNDTHHWHKCSVCPEKQNEDQHTFEQKSDENEHWEECTTCKREKNREAHTFSQEWNSDGTHHWHECSVCHEKQNEDQHTFEQKSNEDEHWKVCTTCKREKNRKAHTFSQEWNSDGEYHWHECECGAGRDKEGHKSKWEHNSAEHWKVCSICKKETDKASHSFSKVIFAPTEDKLGGTKYTCTCGYEYWKDFTRSNMATQTLMPDEEEIYLYCERNGLMVKAEVDVGGKKLTVFLLDPLGVLKKNDSDVLGISVTYIKEGSARYDELMSQLDGDYPIEHINFFEVHPMVNGKTKEGAIDSFYMMYEIPEGWDESDLEMILVRDGDDQEFDEKVLEINGKKYLVMWKNHFSPYAMIDKLTDEEKAALIAHQVESIDSPNSDESKDNSKYLASQVKTGDNSMSTVLMSTAMLITSGLFLEVCIKRKRFCYKILTD